MTEWLSTFKLR